MAVFYPKFGMWKVEIKVSMENDKGKIKKVPEVHLYDAVNPTDAEKQATAEMEGSMYEWEITRISKMPCNCIGFPDEKKN